MLMVEKEDGKRMLIDKPYKSHTFVHSEVAGPFVRLLWVLSLRVTDYLNHQVGRKGNYATCHEWPSS